jgi:hypothetical protein
MYFAATELSDLLDLIEAPAPERRSLRHRSHMRHIRKGHRAVKRLMAAYFRRQKAAIIQHVRPLLSMLREDRKTAEERAAWLLPDTLSPLSFPITGGEATAYNRAITDAIERAALQLAREIETSATLPETFAGNYLRDHSLSRLTGNLTATTKQRLRSAIADAFENGGTADDIVAAIRAEMDDMSSRRAEVIAQTEINQAYNAGRSALAGAAGMNQKHWAAEGPDPCPVCLANEGEGWIPIDQFFNGGVLIPTQHPSCFCGVDFRLA